VGPGLELPAIEFLNEKTAFKVPYTCIALKGECRRFLLQVFFMNIFAQASENKIRSF
jgi:hypothetical protein